MSIKGTTIIPLEVVMPTLLKGSAREDPRSSRQFALKNEQRPYQTHRRLAWRIALRVEWSDQTTKRRPKNGAVHFLEKPLAAGWCAIAFATFISKRLLVHRTSSWSLV